MRTQTNVRGYSDSQIFSRAKLATKFNRTPGIPLLVGVQSNEDAFDIFDDKFYLYDEDDKFIIVTSGTTNAGATGLKDYYRWNPKGTGIWKTDMFYPRCFKYGRTRGMECLRLSTQIEHYRDNNKNDKAEEIGEVYKTNTYAHFHGVSWKKLQGNKRLAKRIGGLSVMCQVANDMIDYEVIINHVKPYKYCDYVLLKEWEIV